MAKHGGRSKRERRAGAAAPAAAAASQPGHGASDARRATAWGLRVGLVALTFAAFWPALSQGLVDWDDSLNLLENERFRGFTRENLRWMFFETHVGHWQPLTWLSFAVDWALWEDDWPRYHLTSLVLHAANALLFMELARRLCARVARRTDRADVAPTPVDPRAWLWAGALAAAFFALHPLRVESVAWATERRDVLAGGFLLLTLLAWLRATDSERLQRCAYVAALACFVLSLFSKAWGITLPVVLLVLDAWPLRRWTRTGGGRSAAALVLEKLPFAALALFAAVVAFRAQTAGQAGQTAVMGLAEHPLANRVAQAAYGLVFYVWKTLWPTGLSPLYELEVEFDPTRARYVAAVAVALLTTAVLVVARRRAPALLVAWLAFAIIVSPVSGLAQSGAQLAADRYTYLACMPFALLAGWAFGRGGAVRIALGVALALVLVVLSFRQTRVWRDSPTLWAHVVAVEPQSYVAHYNQAVNFHRQGRFDEAQTAFRRSVNAHPGEGNFAARLELAKLHQRAGDRAAAEAELRAGLELAPQVWDFLTMLGQLVGPARRAELEPLWRAGVAADPKDWRGRYGFGEYLASIGKPLAAIEAWRRTAADAADADDREAWIPASRLARALAERGAWGESEQAWAQAVAVSGRVLGQPAADAVLGRVQALVALGRAREAQLLVDLYLPNDPRARALLQAGSRQ